MPDPADAVPFMRWGLSWLSGRLDAAGALPVVRCDILVEDLAVDAEGESAAEVALESVCVPCRVRPLSGEMLARQGRDATRRVVRIHFDAPPFPEDDARRRLIRVGGRTYRPIDALDMGSAGIEWRVDCELVTG